MSKPSSLKPHLAKEVHNLTRLNRRPAAIALTLLALAALTLIALTAATPTGDVEYDLVIVAGMLVDGTGAQPAEQVAIAIRGDRIADIISVADGQIPRATESYVPPARPSRRGS